MAFDLNVALRNKNYAYNAWINATQLGNTIKISPEDLEAIEEQYASDLTDWLERYQEYDATDYDVPDFDSSNYTDEYGTGVQSADIGVGYDWQSGLSVGLSGANILVGELLKGASGAMTAAGAGIETGLEFVVNAGAQAAGGAANAAAGVTSQTIGEVIVSTNLAKPAQLTMSSVDGNGGIKLMSKFFASDGSEWFEVSVNGGDAILVHPDVYAKYLETEDASVLGDLFGEEIEESVCEGLSKPKIKEGVATTDDTGLKESSSVDEQSGQPEQSEDVDKSWMIQAPLSAAIAALYWATRPNVEEAKALEALGKIMETGSTEMKNSVARMIELSKGAASAATLAAQASIDFAKFMADLEAGIGTKQEQLDAALLQREKLEEALAKAKRGIEPLRDNINEKLEIVEEKIANGETPTPEEQAQIDVLRAELAGLYAPIDNLLADIDAVDAVIKDLQADIAADKAGIEGQKAAGAAVAAEQNAIISANSAEMVTHGKNIAYQQGVVNQAKSQDTSVLWSTVSEVASQGGNVYSGIKAGIAALKSVSVPVLRWYAIACAALGFSAAAGSTAAAVDQGVAMAKVIGEMSDRKDLTENIGSATAQFETSTGETLESFDSGILSENTILDYEPEDFE